MEHMAVQSCLKYVAYLFVQNNEFLYNITDKTDILELTTQISMQFLN